MSSNPSLDSLRAEALAHIERSERKHTLAIMVAAVIEAAFLISFLLLSDLHNRMHLLLFISTIAVYSIVGAGLFALGAFINRAVLRVLKALELMERSLGQGR